MNYHELNYISLASVSMAFILSLFLPSVKQSIYFYRDEPGDDVTNGIENSRPVSMKNRKEMNFK